MTQVPPDHTWGLDVSISVTTRQRRPSEIDGKHYNFIDREAFDALRGADNLLEWAEVHGNFYGTPRKPVEKVLGAGRDMIFDIDYQGTRQVRAKLTDDVVTVFILPPSLAELRHRLERRAEDSPIPSRSASPTPASRSSAGASTITSSSTTTSTMPSGPSKASSSPSA